LFPSSRTRLHIGRSKKDLKKSMRHYSEMTMHDDPLGRRQRRRPRGPRSCRQPATSLSSDFSGH
jgi:hypothetical protein